MNAIPQPIRNNLMNQVLRPLMLWGNISSLRLLVLAAWWMSITISCGDPDSISPVQETGTLVDIEGNSYQTIKIGNQWWMAENLRSTTFRTGRKIEHIVMPGDWNNASQPAFTTYNNVAGVDLLYNFHVVSSEEDIAPYGWHIPTDEDWKILEEFIGMPVSELDKTNWRGTNEGDQLKEVRTNNSGWIYYDDVWGTNSTGFSATGGSCRVFNGDWGVPGLRHSGYWWTSTESNGEGWFRYLDYKKSGIFRYTAEPNYGFSIRCVKD